MEVDGMTFLGHDQHHHDGRVEGAYFYRVTSEHSAAIYHPRSSADTRLFQTRCEFAPVYVTRQCIAQHLHLRDAQASPFISVFSDFVEALREAYSLYLRGHEAVQIVQMDASNLFRSDRIGNGVDGDLLMPVWEGDRSHDDEWLCMTDIAPLLDVDPRQLRASEWLACGSIIRHRYSAAWPISGGKLHFEEQKSEDLEELLTYLCGQTPDRVQEYEDSGRFEYDWDEKAFFGKGDWNARSEPMYQSEPTSAGVGLDLATSRFASSPTFAYAGYLRGMIIID